ncbi:hypothetical protein AB0P07_36440 [Streptomyces sp. NPDC085944]|uniref:hypothetical protein n=1 Tax=Streptomyces sp. NPDC085944 TaxID=3154962 RepID=UPI003438AC56
MLPAHPGLEVRAAGSDLGHGEAHQPADFLAGDWDGSNVSVQLTGSDCAALAERRITTTR